MIKLTSSASKQETSVKH